MPGKKTHIKVAAAIGGLLAAAYNLSYQKTMMDSDPNYSFKWGQFLLSTCGGSAIGAAAGMLPDILEPATSCHHRDFFHSFSFITAIGYGLFEADKKMISGEKKAILNLSGAGYLSHLLLDEATPMWLPII